MYTKTNAFSRHFNLILLPRNDRPRAVDSCLHNDCVWITSVVWLHSQQGSDDHSGKEQLLRITIWHKLSQDEIHLPINHSNNLRVS